MAMSPHTYRVPIAVHVLALGIFAMVMSEFATSGLMPQLAQGLQVSLSKIGYLVSAFSAAMAFGGPVCVFALRKITPRKSLVLILIVFLAGNMMAMFAHDYPLMVIARIVSGMASQAFFGVSITLSIMLVDPSIRGRAIGVVLNGLMLGTLIGLPAATFIGEQFTWRAAFGAISLMALVSGIMILLWVPDPRQEEMAESTETASGKTHLSLFLRPHLLLALISSTLIIGATFSAFNFFTPILVYVSGFAPATVPWLLLGYGAATVIGNHVVARLADRYTMITLLIGTLLNALFIAGFALWTHNAPTALIFMLAIGLVGVTMNPAMGIRVQRAGNASSLINTVHASFITFGVMLSSAIGSALIDHYGLRAPLVLGVVLALLALVTIVVGVREKRG